MSTSIIFKNAQINMDKSTEMILDVDFQRNSKNLKILIGTKARNVLKTKFYYFFSLQTLIST